MKYKLKHDLLKEKMDAGTNDLNDTISFCTIYNLYDDMKKVLSDYPDYDYDFSSVISEYLSKKRKDKYFDLIKSKINFDKLDFGVIFLHVDLWNAHSNYTNINILQYVFDNIVFTDDVIEKIGYFTCLGVREILGVQNNKGYTINREFNGSVFYWGINNQWTMIEDEICYYYNKITANFYHNQLKDKVNDYIYVNEVKNI